MSPPYPSLYLHPSISLHRHTPCASVSCVFLSLGATLSPSESSQSEQSKQAALALSLALSLSFSLPLLLVLGRRRNSLDVSESLALFYQPSVVDRPDGDWPSIGTIPDSGCAPSDRWTCRQRADRMHNVAHEASSLSCTCDQSVVAWGTPRSTPKLSAPPAHVDYLTFQYRYLLVDSRGSTQYRRCQWRCSRRGSVPSRPLSLSLALALCLSLSLSLSLSFQSPARFSTRFSVRRSEIRSWRSMNTGGRILLPFTGVCVLHACSDTRGRGRD